MKKSLIKLYKSLNDKPLHEQFPEDDEYAKHMKSSSTQMTGDAFGKKTYGDLSPEEWEVEREKYGIKTHPDGHKYVDREYDPGNEPLQIQTHDGEEYYIEPEDIEAYVNGEEVLAIDPDRGADPKWVSKDDSDVTPEGEERIEDFKNIDDDDRFSGNEDAYGADLEEREYKRKKSPSSKKKRMPADGTPPPQNEQGCTEQEIAEGTCGYGVDGDLGNKPAGSHLMDYVVNERTGKFVRSKNKIKKKANKSVIKRLQKLANIKKSEN